jgi:hypothetical protein
MSFRWGGLRARRMLFFASLLLLLPLAGLLAAALAPLFLAPGLLGLLLASLLAVVVWQWLLAWPCPRCTKSFARRTGDFVARAFPRYCVHCRLPEWATAHDAIAPPEPPVATDPTRPNATLEPARLIQRRHRRVGYALVAVAAYLGFCRLPAGHTVTTPGGRRINVLSLTRHLEINTATGRSTNILLQYYTLSPGDTAEARDVLALAFEAARQTGDSLIVVEQINGRPRWRWLGVRIAGIHRYRQTPAGDWRYGA